MKYGETFKDRLRLDRVRPKIFDLSRKVTAPYKSRTTSLRQLSFRCWGTESRYFIHPYNTTWRNERCIEVPIALEFLRSHSGTGLEFGNVLGHYGIAGGWTVVDKYEKGDGVVNVDIVDFKPESPLDFIVGISTIEHVGWDEPTRDSKKVLQVFDHLRLILGPQGTMLLTAPLGYNPVLDEAVTEGRWEVDRQCRFVKDNFGRWHQDDVIAVVPWGKRDAWPPAIWVGEISAPG